MIHESRSGSRRFAITVPHSLTSRRTAGLNPSGAASNANVAILAYYAKKCGGSRGRAAAAAGSVKWRKVLDNTNRVAPKHTVIVYIKDNTNQWSIGNNTRLCDCLLCFQLTTAGLNFITAYWKSVQLLQLHSPQIDPWQLRNLRQALKLHSQALPTSITSHANNLCIARLLHRGTWIWDPTKTSELSAHK
jgi:hypothetical protein